MDFCCPFSTNNNISELLNSKQTVSPVNSELRGRYLHDSVKSSDTARISLKDFERLITACDVGQNEYRLNETASCKTLHQSKCLEQTSLDKSREEAIQQGEVSSSRPALSRNDFGPLLLEALKTFVFVINSSYQIVHVSDNVDKFLHFGTEQLNGQSILNFIHPSDQCLFTSAISPLVHQPVCSSGENTNKSTNIVCRLLTNSMCPSSADLAQLPHSPPAEFRQPLYTPLMLSVLRKEEALNSAADPLQDSLRPEDSPCLSGDPHSLLFVCVARRTDAVFCDKSYATTTTTTTLAAVTTASSCHQPPARGAHLANPPHLPPARQLSVAQQVDPAAHTHTRPPGAQYCHAAHSSALPYLPVDTVYTRVDHRACITHVDVSRVHSCQQLAAVFGPHLVGHSILLLTHPEDRGLLKRFFHTLFSSTNEQIHYLQNVRISGLSSQRYYCVKLHAKCVHSTSSSVLHVFYILNRPVINTKHANFWSSEVPRMQTPTSYYHDSQMAAPVSNRVPVCAYSSVVAEDTTIAAPALPIQPYRASTCVGDGLPVNVERNTCFTPVSLPPQTSHACSLGAVPVTVCTSQDVSQNIRTVTNEYIDNSFHSRTTSNSDNMLRQLLNNNNSVAMRNTKRNDELMILLNESTDFPSPPPEYTSGPVKRTYETDRYAKRASGNSYSVMPQPVSAICQQSSTLAVNSDMCSVTSPASRTHTPLISSNISACADIRTNVVSCQQLPHQRAHMLCDTRMHTSSGVQQKPSAGSSSSSSLHSMSSHHRVRYPNTVNAENRNCADFNNILDICPPHQPLSPSSSIASSITVHHYSEQHYQQQQVTSGKHSRNLSSCDSSELDTILDDIVNLEHQCGKLPSITPNEKTAIREIQQQLMQAEPQPTTTHICCPPNGGVCSHHIARGVVTTGTRSQPNTQHLVSQIEHLRNHMGIHSNTHTYRLSRQQLQQRQRLLDQQLQQKICVPASHTASGVPNVALVPVEKREPLSTEMAGSLFGPTKAPSPQSAVAGGVVCDEIGRLQQQNPELNAQLSGVRNCPPVHSKHVPQLMRSGLLPAQPANSHGHQSVSASVLSEHSQQLTVKSPLSDEDQNQSNSSCLLRNLLMSE